MTKNIFKTFNKNLNSLLPIGFNKVSLKLGKSYFFNKLSFRIQIKGISVFIGQNGTGKSTCIKLLAGLIEPDSGEVIFPRNEINSRIIGYVPQKIILLRRSVKENLSHALSISRYPKNERFSRIDEIKTSSKHICTQFIYGTATISFYHESISITPKFFIFRRALC